MAIPLSQMRVCPTTIVPIPREAQATAQSIARTEENTNRARDKACICRQEQERRDLDEPHQEAALQRAKGQARRGQEESQRRQEALAASQQQENHRELEKLKQQQAHELNIPTAYIQASAASHLMQNVGIGLKQR